MLEFQSTLEFLASPPDGYPMAAVNLTEKLAALRSSVKSGAIQKEMEFEGNLTLILASAHDGHLAFVPDGLSIFSYQSQFGPLVSVSMDGSRLPRIYFLADVRDYLSGGPNPPAVASINGADAAEYALAIGSNKSMIGGPQDPDAIYNNFFYSFNSGENSGPSLGTFTGMLLFYPGPSTSLTYENGTGVEKDNFALVNANFTGIVDGDSFYQKFLNATEKDARSSASATASVESATPTATASASASDSATKITQIDHYPTPTVISEDGSLSGYVFDDPGFEDLAVLALRQMSETAASSFQNSLTDYLDICRQQKKKNLIIDLSGNGGGSVGLGYDTFKQLFPSLIPYGASNSRAHEGFELLGRVITNLSTEALHEQPDNYTNFGDMGGTTVFAAETYLNDSLQAFSSFDDYYGPVQVPGHGQSTNLNRYNLSDPEYDESFSAIVISGYANESNLAPQPFEPENMIVLTDGNCGSTCTLLTHFLKWQGKVKSIAIGGRSQTGPMQTLGQVKGSQVIYFSNLIAITNLAYEVADNATLDAMKGTSLETIYNLGDYVTLRTASGGEKTNEISFNMRNNIAEGDTSYTPLQFVYEAADCRLFYTPEHVSSVGSIWATVAGQAFGTNGTKPYSLCVDGSTNHKSSLSGNATLFNDGNPTNVTDFIPDVTGGTDSQNSSSQDGTGSGDGSKANGAATFHVDGIYALCVAVFAALVAF
ncbi:hypothetical protein LTS17_009780 [Exophiala oligosperma]